MSGNAKKRREAKRFLKDNKENLLSSITTSLAESKNYSMASLISVDALVKLLVSKEIIKMDEFESQRMKCLSELNKLQRKKEDGNRNKSK